MRLALAPDPAFTATVTLVPMLGMIALGIWAWQGRDDEAALARLGVSLAGLILLAICLVLGVRQARRPGLVRHPAWRRRSTPSPSPPLAGLAERRAGARALAHLAWNGQQWQLTPADPAPDAAPLPVTIDIALDLGPWLLLRCRPGSDDIGADDTLRFVCWFALSRAGHAASWHALRCALYSPRPRPTRPA